MGFNTVAVIYNDHIGQMQNDPDLGRKIRLAVLAGNVTQGEKQNLSTSFGHGKVICQDHSDNSQVVIIKENTGRRVTDDKNLDSFAINQMIEALENNGYIVKKNRKFKRSA